MARPKKSSKTTATDVRFNDQLVLFRYFLNLFGKDTLKNLAGKLNDADYEGYDENQNTYFYGYLKQYAAIHADKVSFPADKLRIYDENICRYVRQIGEKRGGLKLKYYQYIALLFTEYYLDRYLGDRDAFVEDLNAYLLQLETESLGLIHFEPFTAESMNKLAYMCATGSGKTLIMHINILQFQHYLKRAQRLNSHLQINKIIVLAPNEGMSKQHLDELRLSSIPATIFDKNMSFLVHDSGVVILDMNKLKEEGKVKTVSIDSFEQNNIVLVDEAHRGLAGDVWYDYRTRLSQDGGFAFEYSATFKQALRTLNPKKAKEQALLDEYCKAIIMDYSYKFFYDDGYGKEYRIYNLREGIDARQKELYLIGCLLTFYQQMKLYEEYKAKYAPFQVEKPLMVFVGNRVTASTSKDELTDVEEVLVFLDNFLSNKEHTKDCIEEVLRGDTGLVDRMGRELFSTNFLALESIYGHNIDKEAIYRDILRIVFGNDTASESPRLHMENLRQVSGEIALRVGDDGAYFGVISIGDTATLMKNCALKGIVTHTEEFASESLFRSINTTDSGINVLIGSRKFTEGWNSWRVSTMGLINFAKGEGSQAIQLFGRGVRLHGYNGCLKRSRKLDDRSVKVPQYLELLETLTIFGIKAQYMEDFKKYLEMEDMPSNETIHEFRLPVINRYNDVKDKKLRVIRVKDGANFKRQSKRLILDVPDAGFLRYLNKSKTVIDCRSKVQTIESEGTIQRQAMTEEHTLDKAYLPMLDYQRIFVELEQYKNEKLYYNISLVKEKFLGILQQDGWYSLIIPESHIRINSIQKLESATDYAVMVLKSYIDKFFKYEKERWEAPLLEYQELQINDNNFVDEYTFSYTDINENDTGAEQVEKFVADLRDILNEHSGIPDYEKDMVHGQLVAFDFRNHLYAPLICLKSSNLQIQVTPVALNKDEKVFVDLLRQYLSDNKVLFEGKNLYLLRNKSKTGMGFFEAGNFYPDYIMWMDTDDAQYVTFIDPKGLLRIMPDDPKVDFYLTIKDLESRLQPSSNDKRIILNSFILSGTPFADLRQWWTGWTKTRMEEHHVMCLDNSDCIEMMFAKLFSE